MWFSKKSYLRSEIDRYSRNIHRLLLENRKVLSFDVCKGTCSHSHSKIAIVPPVPQSLFFRLCQIEWFVFLLHSLDSSYFGALVMPCLSMCESRRLCVYLSVCIRATVPLSNGVPGLERAGRGKVQPGADLHF